MISGSITCILMGDGTLLIQCGGALIERGYNIAAVVTASDTVAEWATKQGLRVFTPGRDLEDKLGKISYDWFFSVANLRIVPNGVWRRASKGAANFHDGPLPRHAGLNAPAWALIAGDTTYGVTWHALVEGIDEGGIYTQSFFDIGDDETAFSLNTKCFEAGISSFNELMEKIETGSVATLPQNLSERSYHARHDRPEAAATIDVSESVVAIDRLARALAFGEGYLNPLGLPKLRIRNTTYAITALEVTRETPAQPAGTIVAADEKAAVIAYRDGAVRIGSLSDAAGARVPLETVLHAGDRLDPLSQDLAADIDSVVAELVRNEAFFQRRLGHFRDVELHGLNAPVDEAAPQWHVLDWQAPETLAGDLLVAGLLASLARLSGQERFDVAFADEALTSRAQRHPGLIAGTVPLAVAVTDAMTVEQFTVAARAELTELRRRVGYCGDLIARQPRPTVLHPSVAILQTGNPGAANATPGSALTFVVPTSGTTVRVIYDGRRMQQEDAEATVRRLEHAICAFAKHGELTVSSLPLMSQQDAAHLLAERNQTARSYDRAALVHTLIETQASRTPNAVALVHGQTSLTYRDLDARANRVARELISLGVGPDSLVGLYLHRSCDLVIGALAILKAGGAYVPLDPSYPADRIALMIEDSGLEILITGGASTQAGWMDGKRVVTIDTALQSNPADAPCPLRVQPHHLAYVIYTSGSTGRPKGVMVEHRNVVNFFAGMDDRIERQSAAQQVWLAVTSLSFDISVLELFWTLANGFKVVIHSEQQRKAAGRLSAMPPRPARGMDFGLFYWGDDDAQGANKYRLLLAGARFADQNGFTAVWTPERHFNAFGGPYPNPSVTGAAVAAITRNVSVRAGSCVLPLHHPARVAEEWAVVDNISNGRAAIAFASGWMPEDFLLRPENAPPANKPALLRDIDVVRRLWRGEKVGFAAPGEKSIDITTLPRPIQAELPVWVTTAGNADTFREAARLGANVLTHLLGQSVTEVADKIKIYRDELVRNGRDPAGHKVTLMLHTLVGEGRDAVREQAREPMKRYLRSAAALIKQYAWAFPAFKKPQGVDRPMDLDLQSLDAEEMDAIIEFAFLRYFDDSGLFGTVEEAKARVEQLADIGVDEIACLIDFGVPAETALTALEPLAQVVAAFARPSGQLPQTIAVTHAAAMAAAANGALTEAGVDQNLDEQGIGALVRQHGVTHLQCTPAMATMLLTNDEDRSALHLVRHLFLGGEALQGALLKDLRQVTTATIENMYGPTETTIWSSTGPALPTDGNVPLGTPIANTQLYVLDAKLRPQPVGLPGELFIGGDGVTRGYYKQEDLTRERFLANPFVEGGRMYRTGDLVRISQDRAIQFLGRADFQVKVRGYRIELGEIESCLGLHPGVGQAVVVAREDVRNDVRIVAYLRFKATKVSDDVLRAHLRLTLPEFMVPAHFVAMEQFPLTPNAKVDRKALPRPDAVVSAAPAQDFVAPDSEVEKQIAEVFKRILGIERVGLNDNFFGLGGHSLLAVQAHRAIKEQVTPDLKITDIYRFPTVAGLAGHLRGGQQSDKNLDKVAARAAQRRNALAGRRGGAT
jgi:natural product biosynthesis luciferase-like monooxygenase protein